MAAAKKVWHAVHSDPAFMRRVNGWLTLFWVAMIPTWQAARVEVEQQQADERAADPVEGRVVDAMIRRTDVEAAEGVTSP